MSDPDDPGVIYIREKGRLYAPGPSQSRYARYPRTTEPSAKRLCTLQTAPQDVEITGVVPNKLRTLKEICVTYVAHHISLVESLVGFPDIVAVEIFDAVDHCGSLDDWTSPATAQTLALFEESYGSLVLDHAALTLLPRPLLEDVSPILTQFSGLKQLDLSHHQLGDRHELWTWLAQLQGLRSLSLINCGLSDQALQHITTPIRMYKRGPGELQALNLSCNPKLTDGCLRYLRCFDHLKELDLSGSAVSPSGIRSLERQTSLRHRDPTLTPGPPVAMVTGHTGWMSAALTRWSSRYAQSMEDKGRGGLKTKSFYDRSKPRLSQFGERHRSAPCPPADPVIVMVTTETPSSGHDPDSVEFLLSDVCLPLAAMETNTSCRPPGKRRRKNPLPADILDLCNDDSDDDKKRTESEDKTTVVSSVRAEDGSGLDLNVYKKCKQEQKKTQGSLWSAMNSGAW